MKIYCLSIVKDEDDILEAAVTAASEWADAIFMADNGSTDDTVNVIERLAARYTHVHPIGTITGPFTPKMRGELFRKVRPQCARGAWWGALDADEFFIDNPREFLGSLPRDMDTVWSSSFQYRFTHDDLERYEADPAAFLATPVTQRLRYYRNDWSEIRFVRETFPFRWSGEWPSLRCSASPRRIRLRHYKYRSPEQIRKRLRNRREVYRLTHGRIFPHEAKAGHTPHATPRITGPTADLEPEIRQRIVPPTGLDHDTGGALVEREELLPPIQGIKPRCIPLPLWKSWCLTRALARRMPGQPRAAPE